MVTVYSMENASKIEIDEVVSMLVSADDFDTILCNRKFKKVEINDMGRIFLEYQAWTKNPIVRLYLWLFR